MGKPSAPANQTVTQKVELPKWVDTAAQSILSRTQDAAGKMPGPYMGNLIPGINDTTKNAWNMAIGASTMGLPGMYAAQGGALRAADYTPQSVTAQTFPQGDVSSYMNPYLTEVENAAMSRLDQQRQQALNKVGDQAIAARAFGGSRQGVMEGVTNAESARAAGDLSASLRGQGFQQAQQTMQADMNRLLTAAQGNQQAGLSGAQINNQGAMGLANISQALQGLGLQGSSIQEAIGQQLRAYEGQQLAQQAAQYEAQRQAPFEAIGKELAALGAVPYGQTSSTTGPATQQGANPLMMGLGGLSMGGSLFGASGPLAGLTGSIASTLGASTGAVSGGLSGLTALLAAFSDRDAKTDITKVGKDGETGLPLYAYRYKGDPKHYPKVVGPMAQDIERKYPDQVATIAGKKAVNLGFGPMRRSFQ